MSYEPNRYAVNTRTLTYRKIREDKTLNDGEVLVLPESLRALQDACDGRDMMAIYDWQVDA